MNSFQIQLTHDIRKIRKSTSLLVFADKTSNIYEMPLEEYNQLLKENILKHTNMVHQSQKHQLTLRQNI